MTPPRTRALLIGGAAIALFAAFLCALSAERADPDPTVVGRPPATSIPPTSAPSPRAPSALPSPPAGVAEVTTPGEPSATGPALPAAVAGQVLGQGEALPGARVSWLGGAQSVLSDSQGEFSLPRDEGASATLLVAGPSGFERKLVDGARDYVVVRLEPTQAPPLDLRCRVLDSSGRGVRALVSVQFQPGRSFASVKTTSSGEVTIPAPSGVRGGELSATTQAPTRRGYRQFGAEDLGSVLELRLRDLGSISVQVEDSAGRPLRGRQVSCGHVSQPTDDSGRARFDDCEPGSHLVTLVSDGALPAAAAEVHLAAGESRSILLRPANSQTELALFYADGEPAARASVYLAPLADPFQGAVVRSDAGGAVRLEGAAATTYGVWVSESSAGAGERTLLAKVALPGAPRRITVPRVSSLRGRVVLEAGAPAAGLHLSFTNLRWSTSAFGETDAQGAFDLGTIPAGELAFGSRSSSFALVTRHPQGAIQLGDEPLLITLRPTRTLVVTGQLSPAFRARLGEARLKLWVRFSAEDESARIQGMPLDSAPAFQARIEGLSSRSAATIVIAADGFAPAAFERTEFNSEEALVDLGLIDLAPGKRLTATFRLEGSGDPRQIVVNVQDTGTRWDHASYAAADGTWLNHSLPQAKLHLMVWANRDEGRWLLHRSVTLEELRSGDLGQVVIPRVR